ncbi:MAG: hypothetical protein K9K86_11480 [Pseudomonadales bacterium]|nr:hypothetical protein [Pseudomonadales bacterium]
MGVIDGRAKDNNEQDNPNYGQIIEKLYYNSTGLCKSYNAAGGQNFRTDVTTINLGRSQYIPFGWTGMYRDPFTGHYHTHFRDYDPIHARWLSEDPAGYKDGLNLYAAYMGVNGVDALGLDITKGQMLACYYGMYGRNDPLLWAFLRHRGNHISMEGVWGDHDTDQYWGKDNYEIEIENSLDNPFLAAAYLREELENDALGSDFTMRENYRMALGYDNVEAYYKCRNAQFASAKQATLTAMAVIEAGIGVVNEGVDLVITLKDLSEGQYSAAVGLIPFVPAGAGKVIFKHGGDEILSVSKNSLDKAARLIQDNARLTKGAASGSGKIVRKGKWLRGTHGNAGFFPAQIADKLRGRQFNNFNEFRGAFWKEVAANDELASQFNKQNIGRMKKGLSPRASKSQHLEKARSYNLHHVKPIQHGGGVYDLDNIIICTPRYHNEILSGNYHY